MTATKFLDKVFAYVKVSSGVIVASRFNKLLFPHPQSHLQLHIEYMEFMKTPQFKITLAGKLTSQNPIWTENTWELEHLAGRIRGFLNDPNGFHTKAP